MTRTQADIALLMIDIQNDYWKPPRSPRDPFIDTASRLLDFGRELGFTVVHVQHASRRPGSDTFQPGSQGFEIHPAVAPLATESRLVKHTPGSFFGTNLDKVLNEAGVRRVVICGMQTQKCCDTTTREAAARGYPVFFITDAVETFDLPDPTGQPVDRDQISRVTFTVLANGFATVLPFAELRKRV